MSSAFLQTVIYILFLLTWIAGYFCIKIYRRNLKPGYIICINTLIWTTYLYLITEILSIFHLLSTVFVAILWIIYTIICIAYCLRNKNEFTDILHDALSNVRRIPEILMNDPVLSLLVFIIVFISIRSTFLALITAPNNYDSMTYHLSRIMFWIQDHSVSYYDTNIKRQLISPPLAEYINLHVILLTGGDIFVNMLQNLSSYGCIILMYSVLRRIGCSEKWSATGVLLMLTMNAYYAESISTQVDLAGTFYLFIILYLLSDIIFSENRLTIKNSLTRYIFIGVGTGLLYLVKSNAEISVAVILLFVLIYRICKKDRIRDLILLFAVIGICSFALACPGFVRNYRYCGDILASEYMGSISIGTLSPKYVLVNILKNCAIVSVNRSNAPFLTHIMNRICSILGVDINSPEIGSGFYTEYILHMDNASAHLILPFAIPASIIGIIRTIKNRTRINILSLVLLFQFIATAAAIRWQPWGVRLMLPSLAVMIIPIIHFISSTVTLTGPSVKSADRFTGIGIMALILLLCISTNADSYNYLREQSRFDIFSIKYDRSRFDRYFTFSSAEGYYKDFVDIIDSEKDISSIGLFTGEDSYQYPLLANYYRKKQIRNVVLDKDSNSVMLNPDFSPDIIFAADRELDHDSIYLCNGISYECIYSMDNYSFWRRISS